jgi:hypothetical protein
MSEALAVKNRNTNKKRNEYHVINPGTRIRDCNSTPLRQLHSNPVLKIVQKFKIQNSPFR